MNERNTTLTTTFKTLLQQHSYSNTLTFFTEDGQNRFWNKYCGFILILCIMTNNFNHEHSPIPMLRRNRSLYSVVIFVRTLPYLLVQWRHKDLLLCFLLMMMTIMLYCLNRLLPRRLGFVLWETKLGLNLSYWQFVTW